MSSEYSTSSQQERNACWDSDIESLSSDYSDFEASAGNLLGGADLEASPGNLVGASRSAPEDALGDREFAVGLTQFAVERVAEVADIAMSPPRTPARAAVAAAQVIAGSFDLAGVAQTGGPIVEGISAVGDAADVGLGILGAKGVAFATGAAAIAVQAVAVGAVGLGAYSLTSYVLKGTSLGRGDYGEMLQVQMEQALERAQAAAAAAAHVMARPGLALTRWSYSAR